MSYTKNNPTNIYKTIMLVMADSWTEHLNMIALFTALAILASVLYYWSQRKFDHWKKKKVPYPKPTPLLGNYGDYILQKKSIGEQVQEIMKDFPEDPIVGAFYGTEPVAIIQDPEFIKLITTKDFYYFNGREVSDYTHKEVTTKSLFFTYGDNWKVLRQNLTPLFSTAKMKNMFHLIEKCARELEVLLERETNANNVQDVRQTMARFTMDAICSCALGIEPNVMGRDGKKNRFKILGDLFFDVSCKFGLKTNLRAIWPALFYGLRLNLFPAEIHTFFKDILVNVLKERQNKPTLRQDFVDLLIVLKNNNFITGDSISNLKTNSGEKLKLEIDDEVFTAQCVAFFAAGFETSSTTSSFTLFELAKHPGIQERVLAEVDAYLASHDNQVQYDVTTQLPYLEQCIEEAMRLYPVLTVLSREVYEDYTLPNGVRLDKNTKVHLPCYYLHHHPKYFPNPEEYDPDRFSPENKKLIVPYTYFPFGEGPRLCIGMRFAKMQMLSGIVTLLKKYRVELAEGMPEKLEYTSTAMVIQCKTGINLKLVEREGWEGRQYKQAS